MRSRQVSIIITTRNEEKNIEACLKSLKGQNYESIEIIVVDNHSTDHTKAIANKYSDIVISHGPERSAQRNRGVAKSSGQYILYLDADMRLSPGVISECVRVSESDPEITGLYIPEIVIGKGFWIRVRQFERSFYDGTVIDCVRFVPKSIFQAAGGFDESFSGPEDWDFDRRIRSMGKVQVIRSVLYHDEGGFNIKGYLVKKRYYASSMAAYRKKWGSGDPDVKKQLGVYYRFLGVFIEKGRFLKLLKHPVLAFAMCFLRFLVGLGYLLRRSS